MGFLKKLFGQQKTPPPAPTPRRRERSYPSFPEGENHVDDPDVKTLADLEHYYHLPKGYEYRVRPDGSPYVFRPADGMEFKVMVEAGMLTIDEPFTRPDGRTGYHTTEVIKTGT